MLALIAHHMGGADGWFPSIEVNERPFPDGPLEHVLVTLVTVVVVSLVCYGAFALVRDVSRWRKGSPQTR